jgi:hypothetical protein
MPITSNIGCECPFYSGPCQTALDHLILINVSFIIIINEIVMGHWQINCQRNKREQQGNDSRASHCLLLSDFSRVAKNREFFKKALQFLHGRLEICVAGKFSTFCRLDATSVPHDQV